MGRMPACDGVVGLLCGSKIDNSWRKKKMKQLVSVFVAPSSCVEVEPLTVDMGRAARVMAGQQGIKNGDSMVVSGLNTTQGSSLQDGSIVRIPHTRITLHADISARGIGAPNVNPGICDGLASFVVDRLDN